MLRSPLSRRLVAALLLTASTLAACSSSSSSSSSGSSGTATSTAAAVAGAADTHCAGKPVVVVNPAECAAAPDAGGADGGVPDMPTADPATLFNSEGDDDDCKYHVSWQSTTVAKDTDVTLAVVATYRSDSKPVAAAAPDAEIFLDANTPAPESGAKTVETSPGHYTIGPVRFSRSGRWTVRFHFSGTCADSEASPHGHVAFFVNVP